MMDFQNNDLRFLRRTFRSISVDLEKDMQIEVRGSCRRNFRIIFVDRFHGLQDELSQIYETDLQMNVPVL